MTRIILIFTLLAPAESRAVATGDWGGPHVRVSVTSTGATIVFDCARGSIAQRLALDREGRFDVPGRYIAEHGGPVRKGESAPTRPVRYRGRVQKELLTFDLVAEDGSVLGTYTAERGRPARIVKCR
jgi:hypothetical protein